MEQGDKNIPIKNLSYGEKAVGLKFNPDKLSEVDTIKKAAAELIDIINSYRLEAIIARNIEKIAQFTLAIRDVQTAQMWAVKAATWQY